MEKKAELMGRMQQVIKMIDHNTDKIMAIKSKENIVWIIILEIITEMIRNTKEPPETYFSRPINMFEQNWNNTLPIN